MTNRKSYKYALTIISPLMAVFFWFLYSIKISSLSFNGTICLSSLFMICFILGIFSFKFDKIFYAVPFVFQLLLFIANQNKGVIITVTYLFPIILSFYTNNKKYIALVIILNVISYTVSNIIKYPEIENHILGSTLEGFIYTGQLAIILVTLWDYAKKINKMNKDLQKRNEEALNTQKDMINFCINSLSYHSPYLRVHTKNVAFYTKLILDNLTLDTKYKEDCYLGALVHDIGKIYISDSILDKPAKLTNEEFNTIKSHTSKGEELFKSIPYNAMDRETFNVCVNCIKYHHERLDGNGYLKITDIPLESRVIAIADVLDALLSYRSYKPPKTFDQSLEILKDEKLFDQNIVNLIPTLKNQIIEYSEESNNELKNLFKYA